MNDSSNSAQAREKRCQGFGVGRRHPGLKDLMISRQGASRVMERRQKNESRIHWTGEHGIGYSPQTDPGGTHPHGL